MVARKRSRINHLLVSLWFRLLGLLLLAGLSLLGSCGWVVLSRSQREVTVTALDPDGFPPPQAPDSLRILTYNLGHARGMTVGKETHQEPDLVRIEERLERLGAHWSGLGADLIFVQQVDFNSWKSGGVDQAERLAERSGFPYWVKQRNTDSGIPGIRRMEYGNLLLSRFPIDKAWRLTLPQYSEWEGLVFGGRHALAAILSVSPDERVLLVGVDLDPRSEENRIRAAERIISLQRSRRSPMIVLGSFHSTPPGMPDSQVSSTGQNTIELLESFGGFQRNPARGRGTHRDFTWPAVAPRRTIDWILADRNWIFVNQQVLREPLESDHLGVLTTLRFR